MSAKPLINYEGKRVIVTGAYSGIGASLVEMLKESGAEQITVLDIKAPDADVDRFIETDMGNPLSIDAAIAELNFDKRKVSLSIKLLEELQNKEAVSKFSSPLSGKNLPFSSLSEQLDDKKNKKDTE